MQTIDLRSVFADGVCVTKRLRRGRPYAVVTFDVDSQRSEPVTVTVVDEVPAGGTPEDVDFHRECGLEYWDVVGDRLVYERTLEPDETCETLYRLRGADGSGEVGKPVVETDAALIEDPALDLADPTAASTDGGEAPAGETEPDTDDQASDTDGVGP